MLLCCSQKVRANSQPWWGCRGLPHRVEKRRSCNFRTAACIPTCMPRARSGKYSSLQSPKLWGGPGEWSPLLMYKRAGAKPGLGSSQDFAHYSPHLPKAAHFIRQYFCYWSERHSLKSATVKKCVFCIFLTPDMLPWVHWCFSIYEYFRIQHTATLTQTPVVSNTSASPPYPPVSWIPTAVGNHTAKLQTCNNPWEFHFAVTPPGTITKVMIPEKENITPVSKSTRRIQGSTSQAGSPGSLFTGLMHSWQLKHNSNKASAGLSSNSGGEGFVTYNFILKKCCNTHASKKTGSFY